MIWGKIRIIWGCYDAVWKLHYIQLFYPQCQASIQSDSPPESAVI